MSKLTRRNLVRAAVLAPAIAAPTIARAQTKRWRMVTSWPKRLPGPGMSAERVAERIAALSGGRLQISVSAAGEVVPAFEVLDAVGGGVAEIGHTASFFWQGKQPAAAFYTTVPFGLTWLLPCRMSGRRTGSHFAWTCSPSTSPGSRPAAGRRCGTRACRSRPCWRRGRGECRRSHVQGRGRSCRCCGTVIRPRRKHIALAAVVSEYRHRLLDAVTAFGDGLRGPVELHQTDIPQPGGQHDMRRFARETSPGHVVLHDIE